jgi:N-formylglutamate amidohydrolase
MVAARPLFSSSLYSLINCTAEVKFAVMRGEKDIFDVTKTAAFTLYNADIPDIPVLLSVPHAGRDYPPELMANLRVSPAELFRLEDRYADRLIQPAIASGCAAIVAHRARAWIDLNRAATDIDIGMVFGADAYLNAAPSAKARGGLGLFPRRLQACGELWRRPMERADVEQRIEQVHTPYHHAVAELLSSIRDRFGMAILLDVHSMPPIPASADSGVPPQVVVGDRFGRSAAAVYAELAIGRAQTAGMKAALNTPYSGDYILQRHGNPNRGIHALQLEVDRSLYLDSDLREPMGGLKAMADFVQAVVSDLTDQAMGASFAEAAE